MNYVGLKCPVCGKTFSADDDIVVCPQCGAPYHRECYARVGKCIYSDRHGTPDAWKPPQRDGTADKTSGQGVRRCPRCGAPNRKTALFCSHCGQPLSDETRPPYGNSSPKQAQGGQNAPGGYPPPGNGYPPFAGQPFPFPFDPLGGVHPNEPIGNIPAGDVAKFVQGNTQYYIPVFMNIKRFMRNRFNFSAFFFQGIWMLYRKQYKIGAIITAVQGVLLAAYLFLMKYFVDPLYTVWFDAAGIPKNNYAYTITTSAQQNELIRQFLLLPAQQRLLLAAPMLFYLAALVVMLICGLNGNKIYLKHCLTSIERIHKETSSPTDFSIRLQQEGGLNMTLAAGILFCFLIVYFFVLSY
ncbi:MAG: zinc-ribbon domain-containing protein [Oscillospiraceae bacterium]|jgi:DNA-directed RNA polymerase subunit RPC12/RpoP|nr:zinc-ribbon domain-containing protein [Oscillospiraceae bacterium]